MSNYFSKEEYFTKKKSRANGDRENFLQLYDRTCHRIYYYAFDCCNNCRDADLIMRDSFIYMYDHIGELRKQKKLDEWQKECVDKAFRALLRSQLLTLIHDDSLYTASSTLSESKKEALWDSIIKMSDIDPWRMVPVPGRSSIFSVIADQTMSDLRYMSVVDIAKAALTILLVVAVAVVGLAYGIKAIRKHNAEKVGQTEEIFLDERYYSEYDLTVAERVDSAQVDSVFNSAMKKEKDKEGKSVSYTFPKSIGDTAGTPAFTEDVDINAKLEDIIKKNINDDMSDFGKLQTLYKYVGETMEYSEYEGSGDDTLSILRDCFEYNAGTSLHYSTLLTALYEAAGYRSAVIEGSFVLNGGTEFERTVRHYWNRVSLDGIFYYLDVEADSSANGDEVRDYYFMAASGNPRWEIFERDHVD